MVEGLQIINPEIAKQNIRYDLTIIICFGAAAVILRRVGGFIVSVLGAEFV